MGFSTNLTELENTFRRIIGWLSVPDPTTRVQLEELRSSLEDGQIRGRYVGDKLGTLIGENLDRMTDCLYTDQYVDYVRDLTGTVLTSVGDTLEIAKRLQIYTRGLNEVWIACEPMLDLIAGETGWQDNLVDELLVKQVYVTYFVNDTSWYEKLVEVLRSRGCPDQHFRFLQCVTIPEPYSRPIALYRLAGNRVVGLRGMSIPNIIRDSNGSYRLATPLRSDWLDFLTRRSANEHLQRLGPLTG